MRSVCCSPFPITENKNLLGGVHKVRKKVYICVLIALDLPLSLSSEEGAKVARERVEK